MWSFALTLIGYLLKLSGTTSDAQIRVVNGNNGCSGRVEVYHNGEWGTVCDDSWDLMDAQVVCRQLGCGKAVSAPGNAHFGEGSGKTWLDDVGCSGTESSITECSHNGFGNENCGANEDAGVVCSVIRVVNGDNSCSGRVEVYHNGEWGTVCDDSWDLRDADVVCKQLGCEKAVFAPGNAYFGQGSEKTWLDDVGCSGTESSITGCPHNGFGKENCSPSEDAGVVCSVGSNIRLANSSGYCSGRVEVYHNGAWGTVCDDSWGLDDAQVVCKQLGCGKAALAPGNAYFGQGSGKTWLDNVGCSGTESSITECSHRGFGVEYCSPSEDAGVVCVGSMKTPTLTLHSTNTAVLPGESAEFTCTITSHRPMTANFRLYRNEISTQTETADKQTVTFSLPSLSSSHQGSYTCDYYYQSTLTASSKSNAITITVVNLHQPRINCTAADGGLSWGPQGPEITKGHSFSIACSTQAQYPGGVFHLSFSGSNRTMSQPAINHSASFYFPAADYSHQGNYSCVYQVDLSSRQFYSTETDMLTVTIREFIIPFIAAGVTAGVVLLLIFALVCIFLAKKRQSKTKEASWKYTKGKTKMNTYGSSRPEQNEDKKGEEDEEVYLDPNAEEDDYENVEMEDQDDYENVEMEDQDDYENVEVEDEDVHEQEDVEDQDDYENAEDYMGVEELDTGCQDEDIYANC
ncbi:soluble scavenger receptor cysteine-rich domain-containing protein SSC5D-like [Alosa pseudoharengus]|uniref:soluble scavenger receptor cysteine-rich domain-containing protein SSC5D-like n=1 Tax=Alosa pseudoharengus TaxID=34774 RepID=UPI003F8987F3